MKQVFFKKNHEVNITFISLRRKVANSRGDALVVSSILVQSKYSSSQLTASTSNV